MEENEKKAPINLTTVLVKLIELFIKIVDGGRFIELFVLIGLIILLVIFIRIEPKDIGPIIQIFFNSVHNIFIPIIFVIIECVTIYLWKFESRVLKNELHRVSEEKKYYAHHEKIANHHSSKYQLVENNEREEKDGDDSVES